MQDKIAQAREFIHKYNIGRDIFIYILNRFQKEDVDFVKHLYRGEELLIPKEEWMDNIKNKRELYSMAILDSDNDELQEVVQENKDLTNYQLMKKIHRMQKELNKVRKYNRTNFDDEIKTEDDLADIKEFLKDFNIGDIPQIKINKEQNKVGILHLTDLHLNEIINEDTNKFDFDIASKRLQYFTYKAIQRFITEGVKTVYFFGTGDFINSQRRESEKINACTSRTIASMVGVKLLAYVLKDLAKVFRVNVAMVSGNESRMQQDNELDTLSRTENYDTLIYHILKLLFEGSSVSFADTNNVEGVVLLENVDKVVLLTHGESLVGDFQKKAQELKGKWASKGIIIDYILYGHIHACLISDKSGRGGCLCGGNGYTISALNFDSRASQNIYVVDKNSFEGTRIDLQDVPEEFEGYDIKHEIKKYAIKGVN